LFSPRHVGHEGLATFGKDAYQHFERQRNRRPRGMELDPFIVSCNARSSMWEI
jgi:hypothetical protein